MKAHSLFLSPLDGSDCTAAGLPEGNWVGPTLFTDVTTEMAIYREEIF